MSTKHTGWTVDEAPDADGNWTIRPADGSANGDTEAQPIATVYFNGHAALIAAAPELLAALQAIFRQTVTLRLQPDANCLEMAARAIAKSEGR